MVTLNTVNVLKFRTLNSILFMSPVAKQGHIVFAMSVGSLVCWLDNFNSGHNF